MLILLLGMSLGLQAQSDGGKSKIRMGIHAMPNVSFLSTTDEDLDTKSKLKFGFGLITEFNFADNYSFLTGVDYVMRGGEFTKDFDQAVMPGVSDTITELNAAFIQIPLMLKMRTKQFGYMKYFAEFGGIAAFRAKEELIFKPKKVESDVNDNYVAFADFIFSVGLGAEYHLGGQTYLLLGVYYNHSLSDILKKDKAQDANKLWDVEKYNYRFNYVGLKVGVLF